LPTGSALQDSKGKQAKLKSPNQLQELLDITRSLLQVGACLPACLLLPRARPPGLLPPC
jgi:hypothetical protein